MAHGGGFEGVREPHVLERAAAEGRHEFERASSREVRDGARTCAVHDQRAAGHRGGTARAPRRGRPIDRQRGSGEFSASRRIQDHLAVRRLRDVLMAITSTGAEISHRGVRRGELRRRHRERRDRGCGGVAGRVGRRHLIEVRGERRKRCQRHAVRQRRRRTRRMTGERGRGEAVVNAGIGRLVGRPRDGRRIAESGCCRDAGDDRRRDINRVGRRVISRGAHRGTHTPRP